VVVGSEEAVEDAQEPSFLGKTIDQGGNRGIITEVIGLTCVLQVAISTKLLLFIIIPDKESIPHSYFPLITAYLGLLLLKRLSNSRGLHSSKCCLIPPHHSQDSLPSAAKP
jgi:hypothetical protein